MQILSTKLFIPPLRSRLVKRGRLLPKLNQGMDCGFLLVSAPAGYGKTTLLSGWISHLGQPAAWLSLDESDNDPARFLAYLAAALRKVVPAAGEALEAGLRLTPLPPIDALLTPVVNCLVQVDRPFWLVLDDYHVIQHEDIHKAIRFLLENRPGAMRLAISTRADPPLPLSRMRARSQMVELRLADLRFTTQETAEFLGQVMELYLSHEDLNMLETITEGWVAGLQMAGLSLQGRNDASAFIQSFSGENRYVLDFLFEEVFNKQPADIQNFLLQTSILDHLCGALCDAVTLRQSTQEILETLEKNNLFLIGLDEQKQWYRYHHLFGDLIRSRLMQTLPGGSAVLHQRASAWYAAKNDLENAIAHSLTAKDFEQAASLIEQIAERLDRHNKQVMLNCWLESLPVEVLKNHPWLCVYRAWGYYWTGRRGMEEEWLRAAEKSIAQDYPEGDPERRHILGHIATIRAMTALTAEDIPRVLELGQESLALLPEGDEMRCETAIALGGAYWALGDVTRSEQAFGMARDAALLVSNTHAAPPTCYVGVQQVKQGRLQDAIATFQDGLYLATLANGIETPVAGFPNMKLGEVLFEQNELTNARQYLKRGLEQCIQLGQPDVMAEAYICFGRFNRAVGELNSCKEAWQQAELVIQQARVDPFILSQFDEYRIKAWVADGNLEAISLWAHNCGLSVDGPFNYLHDLHHQNLARALVAQGVMGGSRDAQEQASELLANLRTAAELAGWVHDEIKVLILQAVNDLAQSKADTALQYLARAVFLAEPGGYVRVFLDEGEILRGLLAALANNLRKDNSIITKGLGKKSEEELSNLRGYVLRLLSAFEKSGNQAIKELELSRLISNGILEDLSNRELEVLKLLAQGCPDKKIAEELVIARETVHKHLKNIYNKLDVHSRTEAIARAGDLGLL